MVYGVVCSVVCSVVWCVVCGVVWCGVVSICVHACTCVQRMCFTGVSG